MIRPSSFRSLLPIRSIVSCPRVGHAPPKGCHRIKCLRGSVSELQGLLAHLSLRMRLEELDGRVDLVLQLRVVPTCLKVVMPSMFSFSSMNGPTP